MTGCVGGLIKCWTSFHFKEGKKKSAHATSTDQAGAGEDDQEQPLSLLHTFNVHTAAVAGIVLHPTSGMAISASMDGVIRVLNLEMFTEIYSINLHGRGISRLTTISLPPAPNSAGTCRSVCIMHLCMCACFE
jgi:WD40 repeat protein